MQPYKHSYRANKQEFLDNIKGYLSEDRKGKSKKKSKKDTENTITSDDILNDSIIGNDHEKPDKSQ